MLMSMLMRTWTRAAQRSVRNIDVHAATGMLRACCPSERDRLDLRALPPTECRRTDDILKLKYLDVTRTFYTFESYETKERFGMRDIRY